MVPNSLKIALVAGMAGGILAAVVLADVRANRGVEFVDGPSLTVLTDSADYRKGDTVNIRIINSGSVPIGFSDPTYGLKITGLAGMPIFSGWSNDLEVPSAIEPGEEHNLTWGQTNNEGEQVFDGVYKISVHGFDPGENKVGHTTTINVYETDLTFGS